MEKSYQALLERIKKLMALSQSSNPSEASIALNRAQKLMQEHNLCMDDISMSEINEKAEEILPALRDRVLFTHLAGIIGRAFGVEYFFTHQGRVYQSVSFIGPKARLATACYTFTILARQAVQVKKDFRVMEKKRILKNLSSLLEKRYSQQTLSMAFFNNEIDDLVRKTIDSTLRQNTKAYLHGWLRAVYEKVVDFAQDEEENRLIENYMQRHHPDLAPMRARTLRFSRDQMQAYGQGKIDGQDGFELYHGVNGAAGNARLNYNK